LIPDGLVATESAAWEARSQGHAAGIVCHLSVALEKGLYAISGAHR
jgi:hypothetical protein